MATNAIILNVGGIKVSQCINDIHRTVYYVTKFKYPVSKCYFSTKPEYPLLQYARKHYSERCFRITTNHWLHHKMATNTLLIETVNSSVTLCNTIVQERSFSHLIHPPYHSQKRNSRQNTTIFRYHFHQSQSI